MDIYTSQGILTVAKYWFSVSDTPKPTHKHYVVNFSSGSRWPWLSFRAGSGYQAS